MTECNHGGIMAFDSDYVYPFTRDLYPPPGLQPPLAALRLPAALPLIRESRSRRQHGRMIPNLDIREQVLASQ
jgi:hypothetical protein